MVRLLVPLIALSFTAFAAACGGGGSAGDDAAGNASPAVSTPAEASSGATLTGEQLCQVLSGAEVSAAVGEEVTTEAFAFDGCHYTGMTFSGRLTETVFNADEYAAYMPDLTGSWVQETTPGEVVMAYTGDGLVMEAWFLAGSGALVLSVPDGLGESVVLALIESARG